MIIDASTQVLAGTRKQRTMTSIDIVARAKKHLFLKHSLWILGQKESTFRGIKVENEKESEIKSCDLEEKVSETSRVTCFNALCSVKVGARGR